MLPGPQVVVEQTAHVLIGIARHRLQELHQVEVRFQALLQMLDVTLRTKSRLLHQQTLLDLLCM